MSQHEQSGRTITVGFVGKLPAAADFVRRHVSHAIGGEFDRWLVSNTQTALAVPSGLPAAAVRFIFSVPRSDAIAVGVFQGSHDQVGRRFPLAIYTVLPASQALRDLQGLPLAYQPFLDAAAAILADPVALTVAELTERVDALELPDATAILEAAQRCTDALGQTRAVDLLPRIFADRPLDSHFYALHTFMTATDAARAASAGAAPTVLDCPLLNDLDLLAWIDLLRRRVNPAQGCPTFAWIEEPSPRLLLVLGAATEQLLLYLADPKLQSGKLWPLTTERAEAIARAKDTLTAMIGVADAGLEINVAELWRRLS